MKVDIWSDVRCPFCYIGKRKFEKGLEQFAQKNKIEVVWHSFELDPSFETRIDVNIYDYLAERKGQSKEWSVQMHKQVTDMAKEVGLEYNFDKAVVANSFNAHRVLALAKEKGLADVAEEKMFKAYFTDGKNIDDNDTLVKIGKEIGVEENDVRSLLTSEEYVQQVRDDEMRAHEIGVNGVPFFVINNKYAVSGAQAPETFTQALQHAWSEYEIKHPELINTAATNDVCSVDNPNC